jgi:hypothetical protein
MKMSPKVLPKAQKDSPKKPSPVKSASITPQQMSPSHQSLLVDHFIPATYHPPAPKEDIGIQADFRTNNSINDDVKSAGVQVSARSATKEDVVITNRLPEIINQK